MGVHGRLSQPMVYISCVSGCSALNLFDFGFLFLVCGDQMVEQYSMLDLTKDSYAVVLVWSLFT